jgi:NAD(P)-dependent dehydrogenase (short-subunit alcohol dehydrogenase family)
VTHDVPVLCMLMSAMHRSSAATWAPKNVRINCVAAGLMDAPSSGDVSQNEATAKAAAEVGGVPPPGGGGSAVCLATCMCLGCRVSC